MAYFGDDVTDEDAFAALEQLVDPNAGEPSPAAGLSVKVGHAPTRPQCRIADPAAVALLLQRLAAARAEHLDPDLPRPSSPPQRPCPPATAAAAAAPPTSAALA